MLPGMAMEAIPSSKPTKPHNNKMYHVPGRNGSEIHEREKSRTLQSHDKRAVLRGPNLNKKHGEIKK